MTAVMPGPHYRDWATRNGVNALTTGDTCILYPEHLGRGYEKQTGHTLAWFIQSGSESSSIDKVKESFDTHPDWYPLVGGERTWKYRDGRRVQACLSNQKLADHVAREVIRYSTEGYENHEGPNWRLMSIGHNDEPTYWCECDACRAMDGPGSTWKSNDVYDAYPNDPKNKIGPGPLSQRYATFANRVARQVAKQRPDQRISFYAYGSTVAPPHDPELKLEDNAVVEFAYSDHCLKHEIDDPTCPNNVRLKKWIEDAGYERRMKVTVELPFAFQRVMQYPSGLTIIEPDKNADLTMDSFDHERIPVQFTSAESNSTRKLEFFMYECDAVVWRFLPSE